MGAKYGRRDKPPRYGPRKKRSGNPLTSQLEHDDDELEFLKAIDKFKREKGRPFPTWSEVLGVLKSLGWSKLKEEKDDDGT